jgi:ribosomal protein S14
MRKLETKFRRKGTRKCKFCGGVKGLIRSYGLYVCRKCFRERAEAIGFKKYG